MSSFMKGQFALVERPVNNYYKMESDSENEDQQIMIQQQQLEKQKDKKDKKKQIDIESIKKELINRPNYEIDYNQPINRKVSRQSTRAIVNPIIPTAPILIEQLGQLKIIKKIKDEVPPEQMNKFYSELRYHYVPAMTAVYKQGDHNKRFYMIIEGLCVVLKPREKMVGSQALEDQLQSVQLKKTENDPLGVKSAFPDYIVLKILKGGEAFGEGSIKLDIPRSSTVIALENSHFLYLSDAAFMQILDPFMSTALDRKIEYFKQSQVFQNIETNDILGIILEARLITYKSGDILYDEGSKSKELFFIINGLVELSKVVGNRSLVLTSYGEFQTFGEVEILMKINRYTKARVISPRMSVYKIRKNKFFDNLGNYMVFEQMKRNSSTAFKHWKVIYQGALENNEVKDDILQAAQDAQNNKLNVHNKQAINRKIVENQKLNQVKVFNNIIESGNKEALSVNNPQRNILQKVYSNTLQQYQARLLKKPQTLGSGDDLTLRNHHTQNDSMIESTNRNLNDSIMLRRATSKPSFHMKLPSLNSPTIVAPVITIDQVLQSIQKFPKVPKDNIVLSLMYQQAYKYENPEKKAKQIQKVISASFRNVQRQFTKQEQVSVYRQNNNSPAKVLQSLRIPEIVEGKKRSMENFVNFIKSKKIN
ncbi:hypothetical protein pb186bvf_011782 [Paramecium bursaria]